MKIYVKIFFLLIGFVMQSCSQPENILERKSPELTEVKSEPRKQHEYGGWYCPDNLTMFPAVNADEWYDVPVIEGRLPSIGETRSGQSLIYVDPERYPDATPIDMSLPQLAKFQCPQTHREELVIVIQAFAAKGDSIIGFRFPNGGNGSAYYDEVDFIDKSAVMAMDAGRFVTRSVTIDAPNTHVWKVITDSTYTDRLMPAAPVKNYDWRKLTNFNYHYSGNDGVITQAFADNMYGLSYIQNDYCCKGFSEKVVIFPDNHNETVRMEIVIGPFYKDYEAEKKKITTWVDEVKRLSESL